MSFMDGDPVNTNYSYGAGGAINGYGFGFGTMQSPWMQSPGSVDPMSVNPNAGQDANALSGLKSYQGQIMNEAFDPSYYNSLKANAMTGQTTGIDNSYAKMGLAGSSANLGADQSAINQTNMQFYNRQMQDQNNAIHGMEGLDEAHYNDVMGIQDQYSGWQNNILQMLMGLQNSSNQQQASNEQMVGTMTAGFFGGAGSAAGRMGGG